MVRYFAVFVICVVVLTSCVSYKKRPIKVVKSKDDIVQIDQQYQQQLKQVFVGMSSTELFELFKHHEYECYPSGICHFTIITETQVVVDKRLQDLSFLTGGLLSALGVTCILSKESCTEAIVAALNVGINSAVAEQGIKNTADTGRSFLLTQWINFEINGDKVSSWSINQPLDRFIPKTIENNLPELEESLGLEKPTK